MLLTTDNCRKVPNVKNCTNFIVSVSYMENSAYSGKYTFFVFLTCDQKNVKGHVFFGFSKKTKKKRFLELCAKESQTGDLISWVSCFTTTFVLLPDRIVHGHLFVSFSQDRHSADLIDIGFDRPGQYSRILRECKF